MLTGAEPPGQEIQSAAIPSLTYVNPQKTPKKRKMHVSGHFGLIFPATPLE